MKPCKFFLLAGGYGKRAQPLSLIKPKPIFPLDGKPLLHIMLEQLKQKGISEGFINLHHLPAAVKQCVEGMPDKPGIRYLEERELSGGKILTDALPYLADDELLLVVNGDIFLDIPLDGMLRERTATGADIILLTRPNKESDPRYKAILTDPDGQFTGRKIHDPGDPQAIGKTLMFTGVSLYRKNALKVIEDPNFCDSFERKKHGYKINVFTYDGIWLDIGDPRSYMESNFAYKAYLKQNGGADNSLSENVVISPDSQVEHSIIWENTIIENRSTIKNSIVTGNITLNHVCRENQVIRNSKKITVPRII
jgi:mannose-1-phosphate guanylyltransferase